MTIEVEGDKMTIDYDLTKQDYIDFNINYMNNSKSMKNSMLLQRFIIPVVYLALPLFLKQVTRIPIWYWYCVFIIFSLIWIIRYPKMIEKSVTKKVSKLIDEGKATGIVGHHRFTYTNEGIVDKTEFSETKYSVFERVVESDKHIFIYVSSVMAYIIPIRVFKNQEEKLNFLNTLNGK
jgi:hypothetical protein